MDVLRGTCRKQRWLPLSQTAAILDSFKHTVAMCCLPCIRILKTSFVTGSVVPRTRIENKNVQIGSATLYWGCGEHRGSEIKPTRGSWPFFRGVEWISNHRIYWLINILLFLLVSSGGGRRKRSKWGKHGCKKKKKSQEGSLDFSVATVSDDSH